METILIIDKLVSALMAVMNFVGASSLVSGAIAKRIAENRDWTDEERQAVRDDLAANKAAAAAALGLPPPV